VYVSNATADSLVEDNFVYDPQSLDPWEFQRDRRHTFNHTTLIRFSTPKCSRRKTGTCHKYLMLLTSPAPL
ncbi:hypothetical protein J6590_025837, partial [Homalodisca vitripennis]